MNKMHLFSREHYNKFPKYDTDRLNATICGYVRENITHDKNKVTCKLCLKKMRSKHE